MAVLFSLFLSGLFFQTGVPQTLDSTKHGIEGHIPAPRQEAAANPDSLKHPLSIEPRGVVFPPLRIRLTMLAAGFVLVGGLGFLLNQKRKSADRRLGL
jgi:hypothetical protein